VDWRHTFCSRRNTFTKTNLSFRSANRIGLIVYGSQAQVTPSADSARFVRSIQLQIVLKRNIVKSWL
jgi:hypothetical protein